MSRRVSSKSPSKPLSSATRLFTENDEIDLLKSLLNSAGNPFPGGRFSESQIADKIRRLKQKYHNLARSKSSIKTRHDRNVYEIARKIWGNGKTDMPLPAPVDERRKEEENPESSGGEGTINWSDFPYMMKEVSGAFPGMEEFYKRGLKGLGEDVLKGLDEKWKALEMEEAAIQTRIAALCRKRME